MISGQVLCLSMLCSWRLWRIWCRLLLFTGIDGVLCCIVLFSVGRLSFGYFLRNFLPYTHTRTHTRMWLLMHTGFVCCASVNRNSFSLCQPFNFIGCYSGQLSIVRLLYWILCLLLIGVLSIIKVFWFSVFIHCEKYYLHLDVIFMLLDYRCCSFYCFCF